MRLDGVVFRDTDTALHVSYIVGAQPARVPCSLRQALISMMQTARFTNARQRDWYARLVGMPSGRVNFTGLSDAERRAQCAMIRQAVLDRLDEPHACVILARYAQTQAEKEAGVSGLTTHLMCGRVSVSGEARVIAALLTRRFTDAEYRNGQSLRDLSRRLHISKSHLSRIAQEIDQACVALEADAMHALEDQFVPHGVCYSGYSVPILRLNEP